jgi:DNA topoisomerase IA
MAPREINMPLVDAANGRRVLDRVTQSSRPPRGAEAPLTTSSLQKIPGADLKFKPKQTMDLAHAWT